MVSYTKKVMLAGAMVASVAASVSPMATHTQVNDFERKSPNGYRYFCPSPTVFGLVGLGAGLRYFNKLNPKVRACCAASGLAAHFTYANKDAIINRATVSKDVFIKSATVSKDAFTKSVMVNKSAFIDRASKAITAGRSWLSKFIDPSSSK